MTVSTIDFPYLGDLTPPVKDAPMTSGHMWYGSLPTQDIAKGAVVMSKQSLFCLIQTTNQGLYVEMHDPTQPYLLNFTLERDPVPSRPANPRVWSFAPGISSMLTRTPPPGWLRSSSVAIRATGTRALIVTRNGGRPGCSSRIRPRG